MNRSSNLNCEKNTIYQIYRACRLCGAGGGYKMPIIQNVIDLDDSELELKQKIQECVQIQVHSEDKMPPLICELCVDKVNDYHEFLEMCRQTNRRTRLQLGLPLQKVQVQTLDAGGAAAPDSEDDEPLAKGKNGKVKVEKEPKVKVKVEDASTPRVSRPPTRKDRPSSSRRDGKPSLRSRSPSASLDAENVSRETAPRRATRNSEDAAYRSLREMDSPSPPPSKRTTRNSYETDFAFKLSSKTEKRMMTSPKEPVRPTRGILKKEYNKTEESPVFLKPSPKCHKPAPESTPRTTKKPPEFPAPKTTKIPEPPAPITKKIPESPAPKTKKLPETPAPNTKKLPETPAPNAKKLPETPAPNTKKLPDTPTPRTKKLPEAPPPKTKKLPEAPAPKSKKLPEAPAPKTKKLPEAPAPKSKRLPESALPKVARKRTETPPPKPSRKRPPDNEEQIPSPKKIKVPPPPAPTPYTCSVCAAQYATSQALSSHVRAHAPNFTPLKLACNACALWFATSEEATAHHKTHRGTSPYSCRRCGQSFKLHAAFNDHLAACLPYTEVADLKCEACWRLFPTGPLMAQHRCLGEDNRPGGKCSKCHRSYALLKNLTKHESTCQHRKKGEPIVDPAVLERVRPIQVRVAKCDPLLERAADGTCDVSTVVGKYGLDKTCFYPYGLRMKREPDGMVSITDELLDFVHWDSDCGTDNSDDDMSGSAEVRTRRKKLEKLSTLSLKVLFSKKCLGKVPRKVRKKPVREEDAFDAEVDKDINNDITNIIDNLGTWNDGDDDIFNVRGKTKEASDELDFDNIFNSLQNHDEDVRGEPKSSDSNDVSILKAVDGTNADKKLDLLNKELKSSVSKERLNGVGGNSESALVTENDLGELDKDLRVPAGSDERLGGVDNKFESATIRLDVIKEKLNSPLSNDKQLDVLDEDLECPLNTDRTLGEKDKDLKSQSVTDTLDGLVEFETKNEEVTEKNIHYMDKTVESPASTSTTDESVVKNGSQTIVDDSSSVVFEISGKILEDKPSEKSPDKSFTQFCINHIINYCGSTERKNLNTSTKEAEISNIESNLDDSVKDTSNNTDYVVKENDTNTTNSNACSAENHGNNHVSEERNGVRTDDCISEKQLLDALDEQIKETFDHCHKFVEDTAVIERNDSTSKLGDSISKMVDSKTSNSERKSMDLGNISGEEFDFGP